MAAIAPIIHSNGTSAERLLEERETAYAALNAAMDALAKMGPNGRDYYPVVGLMTKAEEQHQRRLKAVHEIMREIEDECFQINEQRR